jgi:hypothetical protein
MTLRALPVAICLAGATLTAEPQRAATQDAFWDSVRELCGRAFEGRLLLAPPGDTTFEGKRLVMHVRECRDDEVRIPFVVGEDRSRTWVLTRTPGGLRLKHDHRHADGSPEEITWYGGDTQAPGTAGEQQFVADEHTRTLLPAAATNVWILAIEPGLRFVYALERRGTERRFRIEFDVTREVEAPPPPWGSESRAAD